MSNSVGHVQVPGLTLTLGAAFVGYLASAILYGGICVQTFIYYRVSHRDGRLLKGLIATLWVLDTLHLALLSHSIYTYVVLNFNNPVALLAPTWSLSAQVMVASLTELLVRLIFTTRVWKLSDRNKLLTGILAFLVIVVFVLGLYFGTRSLHIGTFLNLPSISWLLYLSFAAALVLDITLTGSLCVLLWKNRTGFAVTDSVLRTLVVYVVNTGISTCLVTGAVLVAYAVNPVSFVFIAIYFVLSKTFLNALLASLNVRELIFGESMEAMVTNSRRVTRETQDWHHLNLTKPASRVANKITARTPRMDSDGARDEFLEIRVDTATLRRVESPSSKSTLQLHPSWIPADVKQ